MKFLLSGEGPTDIGLRDYDGSFAHGPMTLFIDRLVEPILGYSARQIEAESGDILEFCSRQELMDRGKTKVVKFAGKKYGKGRVYLTANAQALGSLAVQRSQSERCPYVAILFRDGDGTRSRDEWESKQASIERGFALEGFGHGVPMVPRPKVEAWLLQAHTDHDTPHVTYEAVTGSRSSACDVKQKLAELVGNSSREHLVGLIEDGIIDPFAISDACTSFRAFKDVLEEKVQAALTLDRRG